VNTLIVELFFLLLLASCSTQNIEESSNETPVIESEKKSETAVAPAKWKDLNKEVTALCKSENIQEGLKNLSVQYSSLKNSSDYWNLVGNCYLQDFKPMKARLFFLRALEENPNYIPALNNLALVSWYQGRPYAALSYLKRAKEKNANNSVVSFNLGRLYAWYGLHQKSHDQLKQISERSPLREKSLGYMASDLVLLGRYDEAMTLFEESRNTDNKIMGLYALAAYKTGDSSKYAQIKDKFNLTADSQLIWLFYPEAK
jgi:tetratricopeptide (TPR) repeat protein